MHAHYSAERERALPHPIHRTDVGRAPSAELAPASARAAVAPPAVSPAPPAPTPTPVPAPRVPAREPSAPAPVPVERPAAPAAVPSPPQEQPRPVETGERPPLPEPERAAPTETLVSALDAREPQRTPAIEVPGEPSPEPAPLEDPAQPPSDVGQSANSPGLQATARAALARLEKQLAAPRYLTRRVLRRDSASRSDEDVWRSRRTTLDARVRLVELLRELAGTPERHLAVKALLGRQGCARLEERIEELFQGGPESDGISTALMLWRRQPNPR